MIYWKKLLYLYIATHLIIISSFSQKSDLIFNHINTSNGLSQQSALSSYEDEIGTIWIGTFSGVNRYDGRTFWNLSSQQSNHHRLHGDEILSITGDKKGHVYLLNENGLSIISLNGNCIKNIWSNNTGAITMGKDFLWVAINNQLYFLNKENKIIKYKLKPNIKDPITALKESKDGTLWIGTGKSCIAIKKNRQRKNIISGHISTFFETEQGNMWVGTAKDGAYLFDSKMERIFTLNSNNGLSNNFVRSFAEDQYNRIWIGTFWGLNCFNTANKKNDIFLNSNLNPFSLSHNSVYSLLINKQQTMWVGTYYGGVNYVSLQSHGMKYMSLLNFNNINQEQIIVSRIIEDKVGNIWIGTDGSGLKQLEKKSGKIIEYSEKFGDKYFYNNIRAILTDVNNNLWIAVHQQGLYLFDKKSFQHFPVLINGKMSYKSSIITDMIYFQNKILLSTYEGILIFDTHTHTFENLLPPSIQSQIGKKAITMFLDSKGCLWIGTKGEGLYRYNLKSNIVTKFIKTNNTLTNQISGNSITEITEDKKGSIWISTYGGGVNRFNPITNQFTQFCQANTGLTTNYIQSVKSIHDSLLLIGTNFSLVAFNPNTEKIITEITNSSGFPLQMLLERSMCYTKEHQLYVGGKNGIVFFPQLQFNSNRQKQEHLYFSELKINNSTVFPNDENGILEKPISETKEIVLTHNQNIISINFAATNFINQMQEKYEYTLEAADQKWIKIIGSNPILLTSINAGTYNLRLRSINNTSNEIRLRIVILPPWYLSWTALMLYIVILFSMVYLYISMKNKKLQLQITENEKLQLEQVNKQKLDFFTNISHEFKTPLTLISGQINAIIEKEQLSGSIVKKIIAVQNNAHHLQRLIGELLDFKEQEQSIPTLAIYNISLNNYLTEIFNSFSELAIDLNINYKFLFKEEVPSKIWMDPDQMEKVLYNLLSNAFKFTPENGEITIVVSALSFEMIRISILDSGIGIPDSQINKVFDTFFHTNNQQNTKIKTSNTGIGLSLAKSITEAHKGQIGVHSEIGKGSEFFVDLRVGNSHFPEKIIYQSEWIKTRLENSSKTENQPTDNNEESAEIAKFAVNGAKPTILIVEDNIELREFIYSLFEDICIVLTAADGMEGIEVAKTKLPDLILSDVMMPKMDGTEMCVKLKTHIDTSHIPIILLTARDSKRYIINGFQNGADDYITKPFDNRLLVIRCLNLINTRRLLQEKYHSTTSTQKTIGLATTQLDMEFLAKLEAIISENLQNEQFDTASLAQKMFMSRSSFYNKIEALAGITPLDMINNYRLKKAVEIMNSSPKISILDVSINVGFSSPNYFTKCFKTFYGYTPSEYFKQLKKESSKDEEVEYIKKK